MKKEIIKGFKGFDKNLCCRGYQYEVGKTYEMDENIELCERGFHFCKSLFNVHNYYNFNNEDNRYCEIEALGKVIDTGDKEKSVTNIIKIVREIPKEEFIQMSNTDSNNTGWCNTGDWNTGDRNTGYRNTGDSNTGDWNTGDRNTGYRNTGDSNTGYWNTGDSNTGYWNTGNSNTGYWNTGNSNTGDRNTGDRNTGDRNTGDRNTGDWNKTNRSTGVFCTEEPKLIMFNKETDMSFEEWRNTRAFDILRNVGKSIWVYFENMTKKEKEQFPSAETCGGYLKELTRKKASKKWWNNLSKYDKQEIFNLPNFDLKIFNEIMELKITKKEYNEVMK